MSSTQLNWEVEDVLLFFGSKEDLVSADNHQTTAKYKEGEKLINQSNQSNGIAKLTKEKMKDEYIPIAKIAYHQ